MNSELKRTLLTEVCAPMLVPLTRVGVNYHFQNKQLEKRQEHEVKMAEHKANALRGAAGEEEAADAPSPFERDAYEEEGGDPLNDAVDVAEDLDRTLQQAKETETCGFCRDVLDELENEPPEVQRQGLRELRELKQVMHSDPSKADMDQVMERLEIVPRLVV